MKAVNRAASSRAFGDASNCMVGMIVYGGIHQWGPASPRDREDFGHSMHGDTREVRPTEQLDSTALAAHLRWNLPASQIKGLDLSADMEVSQFPGGHSNLTYLLRLGGAELVLRRPPLGP